MVNSTVGKNLLDCSKNNLIIHPARLSDAVRKNPRIISGIDLRKDYFLRKKFLWAIDNLPFWALRILYSGGYKHKLIGKLCYRILWNKNASHRKNTFFQQQNLLKKLVKTEEKAFHEYQQK